MLKKVPDIAQVLAQEDQRSRRRRLVGWILVAAVGALAALAAWWWFAGSDRRNDQQFVTELAELAVIEEYLPQQLSEADLVERLVEIINRVGASGPSDLGKVMGVAARELAGLADGKAISTTVSHLLNNTNA